MSRVRVLYSILSFVLAILIVGCGDKDEIKAPSSGLDSTSAQKIRPDQQLRNARIFLYNKAIRTTDIRADYIEKYDKFDSTLAWSLKVDFFDSTGNANSNLTADSGLVRERTNSMVANGHVIVVSADSSRLETEQLLWNARDNKIETDRFVRIIQKGDTTTGYGLEADQKLTRIKIKKQVSGALKSTEDVEP